MLATVLHCCLVELTQGGLRGVSHHTHGIRQLVKARFATYMSEVTSDGGSIQARREDADAVTTESRHRGVSPLADIFAGQMMLAPLTRGGNLPFRRLCCDFGAEVTVGEMVFAREVLKGRGRDRALLRHASNEAHFGVQMATSTIAEGVGLATLAHEAGAQWIDLNCGCPISAATKRGLGAALLRKPKKLARLVGGIVDGSPIPVSVKVRTSPAGVAEINLHEVVALLNEAGAAAVTIHGRTTNSRYSKAADWELIRQVAEANPGLPIVGNGDILTFYEARKRMAATGVKAVMTGRGALIKPWIFDEFRQNRAWEPSTAERVAVYRTLACYMKEHFGDDERGRRTAWYFLPFHFDWFRRYMPLPEDTYAQAADEYPLMQTRLALNEDEMTPVDWILSQTSESHHDAIASVLWDSASDKEAVANLEALGMREKELKAKMSVEDESDHEANELAEQVQG